MTETLSRRAMAAGLKWERGMVSLPDGDDWRWLCLGPDRRGRLLGLRLADCGTYHGPAVMEGEILPDLSDDATLGRLEGQVRRAWGGFDLSLHDPYQSAWNLPVEAKVRVLARLPPYNRDACIFAPTLKEALVAALEAHHGR